MILRATQRHDSVATALDWDEKKIREQRSAETEEIIAEAQPNPSDGDELEEEDAASEAAPEPEASAQTGTAARYGHAEDSPAQVSAQRDTHRRDHHHPAALPDR